MEKEFGKLEEGDIVQCIVEKIVGTTVFLKVDGNGEGSMNFSEVSPGRIRNIRDYVVPKKKVICKVFRISGNNIELSLRRVTSKEKKEALAELKKEKTAQSLLRSVLKDNAQKAIEKISEKEKVYEFLEKAKENPKELEEITTKSNAEKLLTILKKQKAKKATIKKELVLSSDSSNGLSEIQQILSIKDKEASIKYLAAGKYTLKIEADDFKNAKEILIKILEEIETRAKKVHASFSVKEK